MYDTTAEKIATRIKMLREEKFLSQEELGNAIGMSRISIGNYEQNKRIPDLPTLIKIAEFFECDINYLMGVTDFKKPEQLLLYFKSMESLSGKLSGFSEGVSGDFVFSLNFLLEHFHVLERKLGIDENSLESLVLLTDTIYAYQSFLLSTIDFLDDMTFVADMKAIGETYKYDSTKLFELFKKKEDFSNNINKQINHLLELVEKYFEKNRIKDDTIE